MGIQQMLLGAGAAKKIYMDDVFKTYVYPGTSSNGWIQNGVGLHDKVEERAVWLKRRNGTNYHFLYDTLRGANKALYPHDSIAEGTTDAATFANNNFQTNGFVYGYGNNTGGSGNEYASWTFGTHKGFFAMKEYTGTGSTQTLSHDLGCVPGCIMIKRKDQGSNWGVYHRNQNGADDPEDYRIILNSTSGESNQTYFGDTAPTATQFTVGDAHSEVNVSGSTYIAYLFGGGESPSSNARGIEMSPNDHLTLGDHADYRPGTGDFTLEAWIKPDQWASGQGFWYTINGLAISKVGSGNLAICDGGTAKLTASHDPERNVWTHVAVCRSGTTAYMFYNGTQVAKGTVNDNFGGTGSLTMGVGAYWDGTISNLRFIKGTALYTSSFRPPTEPLTSVTNTKLLCCNQSSLTGATTSSVSISVQGCTAVKDSPFDDPAGFVYGDNKEGIIKCGGYKGNGSTDGPEVYLGWEPQWILIKQTGNSTYWFLFDAIRGISTDSNDAKFIANETNSEETDNAFINLTPTGFQLKSTNNNVNADHYEYIYIALRREDGYVGKPPEAATDVFTIDTGSGSSSIPTYDAAFPVDFSFARKPASSSTWYTSARLIHGKYMELDTNASWGTSNNFEFDSNKGWARNHNSTFQAWQWKRHKGFDVITYDGNGVGKNDGGRYIPHNLSKTPEMVWVKRRDNTGNWYVWHKDLNGGSNSGEYYLRVNHGDGELSSGSSELWADTTPTATHFVVGNDSHVNHSNGTYIAILFASSDYSKTGTYTGNGSSQTITIGFQPRFLIIKNLSGTQDWFVLDTTRGWGSGDDKHLSLNTTTAQGTFDFGAPTSTGFSWPSGNGGFNANNEKYIYYAHA